jgi:hypothetical protein
MKNTHLFFYVIPFFFGIHMTLWSQIKMGDRPLVIDPHAIFEIESTQQGILLPRMSTLERDTAFRENLPNGLLIFNTDNDQFEVYLTKNQKWEPIKTTVPKFVVEDQILIPTEDYKIDLDFLLDNTDHQELKLEGTVLHLQQEGSVDLAELLIQTNPQKLQLNGTILSFEESGSVDLSPLFDSSNDNQKLSVEENILKLDRGGSVDLSKLFKTSNPQKIDEFQLSNNTISLSLSQDESPPHQISLNNINTDNQSLSLSHTTLSLSRGGSVDLNSFLDNQDQQNLIINAPNSNTLELEISNGNKIHIETNDHLAFSRKDSTTLSLTSQASVFNTLGGITSNQSQNWEQDDFVFGSPQLENDPSSTTDNKRMFFDKSKAAFRAGIAQSDQWDEDQLGTYSIAMGRNTIASGFHATAFGLSTVSEAWYATSMGVGTAAQSRAETVIGSYNSLYTPLGSTNQWEPQDRLFVIGNGTGSTTASRTDALVMLKNGDTTTQGIWKGPGFHIVSARDKKKKLKKLSLGMAVVKELIPYQYEYKEKAGKVQFGFIAEEIETILPNLVYESQGVKSLNYQGLIPVLVNALVEQQKEIEKLKKEVYK